MSTPLKCVHEIALTAEPTGLGAPEPRKGGGIIGSFVSAAADLWHLTSPRRIRPSADLDL
jgi:hypothetical protein